MISKEDHWNIEPGMNVIYDGKVNHLLFTCEEQNYSRDYPIGGMMAEHMRFSSTEIKDFIMNLKGLKEKPTGDNVATAIYELLVTMLKKLSPITAIMVALEISYIIGEWFSAIEQGDDSKFIKEIGRENSTTMRDHIFKDSGYDNTGRESVLQMLLSAYYSFTVAYEPVKNFFLKIAFGAGKVSQSNADLFCSMYGDCIDFQGIDYHIINMEGKFVDYFTIKSIASLFLFEMAHCLTGEVSFAKCPICGHYFVLEGRRDAIYCTYPSPKDSTRSCREIGAQITRANKEKNDKATKEYRRIYMRLQMKAKRHPESRATRKRFECLTAKAKDWRKQLANGTATTEDFLVWLQEVEKDSG